MALILDATVGGVASNSYATASEGTTYHEGHLYASDWTGASAAMKDAGLVMATRAFDTLIEWSGWVATSTQALPWPRSGMLYRNRYPIPSNVIPLDLKQATAEMARLLITANLLAESDIENQKIRALTAGPVSLTFGENVKPKRIPDSAWALLVPGWGIILTRNPSVRELVRA